MPLFDPPASGGNNSGIPDPATKANRDTLIWDGTAWVASRVAWTEVSDKPVSYAPSAHTHPQSEVTNLVTDLAGKAPTSHTHTKSEVTDFAHTHPASDLTATGTRDATTFLRGDNTWATPSGGGGGTARESLDGHWTQTATKTNVGTAFVDVFTAAGSDGLSISIDTAGKTQVRLIVNWNKVGSGTQEIQLVEVGTTNALVSIVSLVSGRNDTGLVQIPLFAQGTVKFYKLQVKSTTAADDPIFQGASVYTK